MGPSTVRDVAYKSIELFYCCCVFTKYIHGYYQIIDYNIYFQIISINIICNFFYDFPKIQPHASLITKNL